MIDENLLIEIVTEELPPLSQKQLGESFGKYIFDGLSHHKLNTSSDFEIDVFTILRLPVSFCL